MPIFTDIKEQLNIREVANYYGLHINRARFTCCPFHNEKTPSMKIYDDHFYCFGCHCSGDVISLVEKLYGLKPLDATKKLQHDFGLTDVQYDSRKESVERERQRLQMQKEKEFKKWKSDTLLLLTDYFHLLQEWKKDYIPKDLEDPIHPLYEEALQEIDKIEYYCDLFLYGNDEDILEFRKFEDERLVQKIANRLYTNKQQSELGRTHIHIRNER